MVQQKHGRVEENLSGRLAGVHGYQFEARALLGCQFDVHSVNRTRSAGRSKIQLRWRPGRRCGQRCRLAGLAREKSLGWRLTGPNLCRIARSKTRVDGALRNCDWGGRKYHGIGDDEYCGVEGRSRAVEDTHGEDSGGLPGEPALDPHRPRQRAYAGPGEGGLLRDGHADLAGGADPDAGAAVDPGKAVGKDDGGADREGNPDRRDWDSTRCTTAS